MLLKVCDAIKTLPRKYGEFSRNNPNANAFILSVSSSVTASYLTAAVIDNKANRVIDSLESRIEDLREKRRKDAFLIAALQEKVEAEMVKSSKEALQYADVVLKLKVCEADFRNAGVFFRTRTLPDEYPPAIELRKE